MKKRTLALALLVGATLSGCQHAVVDSQKDFAQIANKKKVSVQLWSVKDTLKQDFKGTITQLAGMGFDGVEFAGEFGPYKNDPQGLRAFLDSLGLQASGAHIDFKQFSEDTFSDSVKFYQILGVKYLIDPWEKRAWDHEQVADVVKDLNKLADKLAPYDMQIGYHNHQHEFAQHEGATFWDFIAENTSPNVVLQQDVGWTSFAGQDPVAYIKKYPNRTKTTHYKVVIPKENSDNLSPIIGLNNGIDWPNLTKTLYEQGGVEWIVLEQEHYPEGLSPLQSVALSKQNLDKILR
ncbi:sugar phosphate isomerase/epimerase family protein [Pseudoalteromonas sp. S16_S37]|uniref:sugar phosphate isomerase/epimerase family protein n=1 Tax=Pseudoalteromonas sp. S16_S37 TaxID=2720228 RepID=UPI0016811A7B|nr:sugar phosphate isomerase/epimerase [Pseudoalteromonas sp. S16_S37]MBD1584479.1 sugar phosphate isomerase/epimerase [Pseudoalteromonas sp. S16_S37]